MDNRSEKQLDLKLLNEIMSLFYYSSYVPITLINSDLVVQTSLPSITKVDYPFPIDNKKDYEKIHNVLTLSGSNDNGFLYTNSYRLSYIAIGLWSKDILTGCLIAGPFILFSPESININNLIEINNMPFRIKAELKAYYQQSIMINHPRELYILRLLYSLIESDVDFTNVSFINSQTINTEEVVSDIIIKNRELNLQRTPEYLTEELYRFVRLGDLKNAVETKNKINEYKVLEIPGIEGLRNGKNLMIIFSYSLSREISNAGVDLNYAENLCDSFIESIENCNTMTDLIILSDSMLKEYVSSVRKYSITKLHPAIQKALKYINNNISDNVTLSHLAKELNLHQNYLSALFKKEMGLTFQNYISKLRIQEAKRLLHYSDYSILDIALHLGFKSQSHFTTLFKKYEGDTPKEYRKIRK